MPEEKVDVLFAYALGSMFSKGYPIFFYLLSRSPQS
jgi:hypothetical protein